MRERIEHQLISTSDEIFTEETNSINSYVDRSSISERASRIASASVAAAPTVPLLLCGPVTSQNQHWWWSSHTLKPISR